MMLDVDETIGPSADIVAALSEHGVLLTSFGPQRLRAVTHLDIDDEGIDRAVAALGAAADGRRRRVS
ncbi:MAG: hypothetical protein WD766_11780 [Gemmatimonadota bacterium]